MVHVNGHSLGQAGFAPFCYVVLPRGHKSVHQWLDRSASLARYTSMGIPLARPVLISINMLSLSRAFVAISPFITGWTAMPASSGKRQWVFPWPGWLRSASSSVSRHGLFISSSNGSNGNNDNNDNNENNDNNDNEVIMVIIVIMKIMIVMIIMIVMVVMVIITIMTIKTRITIMTTITIMITMIIMIMTLRNGNNGNNGNNRVILVVSLGKVEMIVMVGMVA